MPSIATAFACGSWDDGFAYAEVDAVSVSRSINRGTEYLRKTQTKSGGWREYPRHADGGLTALCTLAMLNAGVPPNDPSIARSLKYLRSLRLQTTYSVALRTLVYCQCGAAMDLPRIRECVAWLTQKQNPPEARNPGGWHYGDRGNGDPSNSQFALLALGAAADRGIQVNPEVFALADRYWRERQLQRGGWSYGGGESRIASGSMTCAGIASLVITNTHAPSDVSGALMCCGNEVEDDAIERGIDFLGSVFTLQANPGGELLSYYYYLYAIERVGRLTGRRLIGNRDWYREGAERLLGKQDQFQGFWQGTGPVESDRLVSTSFAVLFLSKGKRQVVAGRMDHDSLRSRTLRVGNVDVQRRQDSRGQPHPNALRNLVRAVERSWSRDLTWQTIEAENALVEDLLLSPVILVSGADRLRFSVEVQDTLLQYLDQGGTLLFDARAGDGCSDARAFEESVLELCEQWFPGSPLERLPPSHPVWFAERPIDPAALPRGSWLYGVQACCRTPVFFSPFSLTCRWDAADVLFGKEVVEPKLRQELATGVTLGENIIAYATGRELQDKLEERQLVDGRAAPAPPRGAIPVAVAALGAGEEQASRALPNAAAIIRERLPLDVIAVASPIALTDDSLARVGVLYLHGQTGFELEPRAIQALERYIQRGGLLVAAGICGSEAFQEAFAGLMDELLPDTAFRKVPNEHPMFTRRFGGYDLTAIEIRQVVRAAATQEDGLVRKQVGIGQQNGALRMSKRTGTPPLSVAAVNGYDSVFVSPLDLSCALENQRSVNCAGYDSVDAAKLLANILLYALQQ
ncbi:MAG: DUF4159 domain-containing protein [Planctomycetota bacterium]